MKKLYRSTSENMVSGVCGGIAEYFEMDPTIVRLLVVLSLFIVGDMIILLYIMASLIVPKEP